MVGDFKTGLKLAGDVATGAKEVSNISKNINNTELKETAANLRENTIDLKEKVSEMRQRIITLEEQLEFKEKLHFNGKVFEYEDKGQKIYICNGCETKGQYVHMTETKQSNGSHFIGCPVCDNKVFLSEGATPTVIRDSSRRDQYNRSSDDW